MRTCEKKKALLSRMGPFGVSTHGFENFGGKNRKLNINLIYVSSTSGFDKFGHI